jgi:diaminohydroxyphosphoribosylaminopyrimidine deaminase/5-amino-6-(5-phosphoribosylamino)uracil reductase
LKPGLLGELKSIFKNDKLSDITQLNKYSHPYSVTTIRAGLQNYFDVVNNQADAQTILVTNRDSDQAKKEKLISRGVEILEVGGTEKVDLDKLLVELAHEEITSLLVEGGSKINSSFWETKLVDKIYYFIAPRIIGGKEAVPVVGGTGVAEIKDGVKIINKEVQEIGDDILVKGYPDYN